MMPETESSKQARLNTKLKCAVGWTAQGTYVCEACRQPSSWVTKCDCNCHKFAQAAGIAKVASDFIKCDGCLEHLPYFGEHYGKPYCERCWRAMEKSTPDCPPDVVNHSVDHPPHYTFSSIEVITAIEEWGLGFHLGNVVKYLVRSPRKGNELQDLEKAKWYLDRWIEKVKGLDTPKPKDEEKPNAAS